MTAEAKAKQEEKAQKDKEAAIEDKKKAAAVAAKKMAEAKMKETHEAAAAAMKDSDSKAKMDSEAAAAVKKREAAVKAEAEAHDAAKASANHEAQALRAFLKCAPTVTAASAAKAAFPSWQALALPDEDLVKLAQLFASLGFTQESRLVKLANEDLQSLQVAPASMDKIISFAAEQEGVKPSPIYDESTGLPRPNEFAIPPCATGLLLVGNTVSLKPRPGLPLVTFSVHPTLPSGLSLKAQTGEIHGTPSSAPSR